MSSEVPQSTPDLEIMQSWVDEDRAHEPAFRTHVIDKLSKQCAEHRKGLFLRTPPSPAGHGYFVDLTWTEEEAQRYLSDSTLPRTLATLHADGQGSERGCVMIWIFDATGLTDTLPEIESDPLPDFERFPAICLFSYDGCDHCAFIPSEFLRLMPSGTNKAQFIMENRSVDQFRTSGSNLAKGLDDL